MQSLQTSTGNPCSRRLHRRFRRSCLSTIIPAVRRALHEARERAERKRAQEALRRSEERGTFVTSDLEELLGGGRGIHVACARSASWTAISCPKQP